MKPMRMALLLPWRSRGFQRPRYGLVDDEELLLRGSALFVTCDGHHLRATRQELLLLEQATLAAPATAPA